MPERCPLESCGQRLLQVEVDAVLGQGQACVIPGSITISKKLRTLASHNTLTHILKTSFLQVMLPVSIFTLPAGRGYCDWAMTQCWAKRQ